MPLCTYTHLWIDLGIILYLIDRFDSDEMERVELLRRKPRLHPLPKSSRNSKNSKNSKNENEEDLEINSQLKDIECVKCRLFIT